jgi:hypothetical protein
MKIFLPNNIYSRLIKNSFATEKDVSIIFKPSSMLTKELISNDETVALIPTMDLLHHNNLFISESFGISFEGSLCNAYFYFNSDKNDLDKINIVGDVSSVEVVLTTILFKEIYKLDVEINLVKSYSDKTKENVLIVGDDNFIDQKIERGLSFSDEIMEIISLPYVNYVLASKTEKHIKEIIPDFKDVSLSVYDKIENGQIVESISETAKEYIQKNVSSLIMNFDENEIDGITQLLRLPFYHGMIENIVELKLV